MNETKLNLTLDEVDKLSNSLGEALSIVSVLSSLYFEISPDVFEDGHINRLANRAKDLISEALEIITSDSEDKTE